MESCSGSAFSHAVERSRQNRGPFPSGRQIDVFRIFTQGGKNGLLLNYFYVSRHFGDKTQLDAEWAEVVQDAQQEADKRRAVEVMLIASRRGASVLSRLIAENENERAAFFGKQNGAWTEIQPKR
jgi:hypothetical protein